MRLPALLPLLLATPALAAPWTVWPDGEAALVSEVREAAAALVEVGDAAAADTALAQSRELGTACAFGDTQCLQGVMGLAAISQLLWVVSEGDGLRGIAVLPAGIREAAVPTRDTRALVTQLVAPERFKGSLVIEGAPEGARVLIDGQPGEARSELTPGPHKVRVEAEGFSPFEANAVVKAFEETRLTAALTAARADPGPDPKPDPAPDPSPAPAGFGALGYSGAALMGVAAVSAAGFIAWGYYVRDNALPGDPKGDSAANGNATVIAAGIAGGVAVVGAALLGVDLLD